MASLVYGQPPLPQKMGHAGGFYVRSRPDPRPGEARPGVLAVSGHYFDTMGFPILRGRAISPQDGAMPLEW